MPLCKCTSICVCVCVHKNIYIYINILMKIFSKQFSENIYTFSVIKVISENCLLNVFIRIFISFLLMIWKMSLMKCMYIIFLFGK